MNRGVHHRRSKRLPHYDYASSGAYFVTLCAARRACLFGRIVEGQIRLNPMGAIVGQQWRLTGTIRSKVELDEYVIMPNHLHAIVLIRTAADSSPHVGATGGRPYGLYRRRFAFQGPGRKTLSALIGGFKSAVSRRVNAARRTPGAPVWQRDMYERVLRNDRELELARQYIRDNPRRWSEDKYNPTTLT